MIKSSALHVDPTSTNISVSDSESLNTVECEHLLNSHESRYNITGGISRLGLEVVLLYLLESGNNSFTALYRNGPKKYYDICVEQQGSV